MFYRPLPDCLTIRDSEIEGLGLFATKDIPAGTVLGISHYSFFGLTRFVIRTPLGGFYNHANIPNCNRVSKGYIIIKHKLVTMKDIKAGDEITVFYQLYNPES